MENEKKMLSEEEFDELLEKEGMEGGKKYLHELINEMSGEEAKGLYFMLKEEARKEFISALKEETCVDVADEEKLKHIVEWLFILVTNEELSAEEMLRTIAANENIELKSDFVNRVLNGYQEKINRRR